MQIVGEGEGDTQRESTKISLEGDEESDESAKKVKIRNNKS